MFIANPLNESSHYLPVLEGVHLLGIVCGVGAAAVVDLRLMGVGAAGGGPAQLWRQNMLVTLAGLLVAIFSGLLLFSIDPELYLSNPAFRFKMGALVAALLFYYTMVRRAAVRDRKASVVGSISLALYALVPLGGLYIGYN